MVRRSIDNPVKRRVPGGIGPELHQIPKIDQQSILVLLKKRYIIPIIIYLGLQTIGLVAPEECEPTVVSVLPI